MWAFIVACLLGCVAAQEMIVPTDPRCTQAIVDTAEGYLTDPTRCDCWIRCYTGDEELIVSERKCCGCGNLWDASKGACNHAEFVGCGIDSCNSVSTNRYAHPDNCRTYFVCRGSVTVDAMCCEDNERFNAGSQQCEIDNTNTCSDDCFCDDFMTSARPCTFRAHDDPRQYYENENGVEIARPCAPGTEFSSITCGCTVFNTPSPADADPCPVSFQLDCNTAKISDLKQTYVNDAGGNTDGAGRCLFDGSSNEVKAPRFSGVDFRGSFAFEISFNPGSNQNNNGPLFGNLECPGQSTGTIRIALARSGGQPVIQGFFDIGGGQTVQVPYKLNEVNVLRFAYNGATLNLCVRYANGQDATDSKEATGAIRSSRCVGLWGSDGNGNFYSGDIRDFQYFHNCVPVDFC